MNPNPRVTIIVVTYHASQSIRACLDALLSLDYPQARYNIVVVDNASTDDTVPIIQRDYPGVTLLVQKKNLGFGAANNIAMRQSDADFFALVNPDTILKPDWLTHILACMDSDEQIAVAGSKLFFSNGVLLQHVGGALQPNLLAQHIGDNELDIGQYETIQDYDYVTAAALCLRAPIIRELGYFDEDFFLYYEETDLCWRAVCAGYRVVSCPDAKAIHNEDRSLGHSFSMRYLLHYHRSRLLFMTKHLNRETFLQQFWPVEWAWMRQSIGKRERLILLWVYLRMVGHILRVLFS